MTAVNLFEALLVGHLVGDFLVQTNWMAREKTVRWSALLVHSAVYTACVAAAGELVGGMAPLAVALVFVSHAILDRRTFVRWWGRHVQGVTRVDDQWLLIMTDQVWHVLVLVAAVVLTRG
jgi:hypothetical protein